MNSSEDAPPQKHTARRRDLSRALRGGHRPLCTEPCCVGCGECDEEDDENMPSDAPPVRPNGAHGASDDDDQEDEEFADEALLAKIRKTRLVQMQNRAVAQAAWRKMLGTHMKLRPDETLESLRSDSANYPIVLHLGVVSLESDDKLVLHAAEELSRAATTFVETARLVTHVCRSPQELPTWLRVPTLPTIVTLEKRVVSATLPDRLTQLREPHVREIVSRWLTSERERLARQAAARRYRDEGAQDDGAEESAATAQSARRSRPNRPAPVSWVSVD